MVTKQTGVLVVRPTSDNRSWFFGLWLTLSCPVALEICNTRGVSFGLFLFFVFFCYFMLPGNFFVFLLLLAIKLALRLSVIQASFITPQTDWVLYGQASRAISTR